VRLTVDAKFVVLQVKRFGHRYLTKETLILVSLGSMDYRKNVEAVTLDRVPMKAAHSTKLDTALSIVVSARGATGEPSIIDLPVHDNISTEPIAFHTLDVSKVKLIFDIVPTYSGSQDQKAGRGIVSLSRSMKTVSNSSITYWCSPCPRISQVLFLLLSVNLEDIVLSLIHCRLDT
jgi:glycerophosphodiester phosphodiesterase